MSTLSRISKRGDKLRELLLGLPKSERKRFADQCGTTVDYLEELAVADDPNPSARLAFAIQDLSTILARHTPVPVVMARQLCGAPDMRRK